MEEEVFSFGKIVGSINEREESGFRMK